ncbi:hypothetical protein BJF96_g10216 [Verticillium dahliae]|uniref:Uncharacterized protein n=1 Tax=Verticillium dahliae TaxID=27337 RepID=A0AA45AGH7_VERDA|nr:hypothetical protein BJF96_g10216 [Verticillium dahliae]
MDSGKHRVTLIRREEWRTWLNSVRAVATSYEAWDLVDLDKEANRRPKRAKKPIAPSFEDETRDLSTLLTLYKIHLDIYNRESAGLQEVQKYILNTVDRSLSAVFMNEESSQEWLKALKDHFAPSDMGQKQYIRQRWEEHMAMIKKMDHEKWVDDFILLCIEVEKHGIPQLKEAADQNVQFLRAILSVSLGWAEAECAHQVRRELDDRDGGKVLALRYKSYLRDY